MPKRQRITTENLVLGLDLTAIVEAANQSDATGKRVDLDPSWPIADAQESHVPDGKK